MCTLLQLSYSKIATNVIQEYNQSLNFWEIFYVFVKSIILSTIYRSFCFIISFPFLFPHLQTKISCRLISSRNDACWNVVLYRIIQCYEKTKGKEGAGGAWL